MTLTEQIRYRAKAILTALGVSVLGLLGWLVGDPRTATAIQEVLPAPWAQFVPLILAGAGATLLVNFVPNRTPTILTRTDGDDALIEPATDTTAVSSLLGTEDGAETSGGR